PVLVELGLDEHRDDVVLRLGAACLDDAVEHGGRAGGAVRERRLVLAVDLGALAEVERLLTGETEARRDRVDRDARAKLEVQLGAAPTLDAREALVDERGDP